MIRASITLKGGEVLSFYCEKADNSDHVVVFHGVKNDLNNQDSDFILMYPMVEIHRVIITELSE